MALSPAPESADPIKENAPPPWLLGAFHRLARPRDGDYTLTGWGWALTILLALWLLAGLLLVVALIFGWLSNGRVAKTLVLLLLGYLFLGIFPLTYLAYRQFRVPTKIERLADDFRLLGLAPTHEVHSTVTKLFAQEYSARHYFAFLSLIFILCLLALLIFFSLGPGPIFAASPLTKPLTQIAHADLGLYAFLGAYIFGVMEVVRRYNTLDLLPQAYSSILVRMIVSVAIVLVGSFVLIDPETGQTSGGDADATAMPTATATVSATATVTDTSTLTSTAVVSGAGSTTAGDGANETGDEPPLPGGRSWPRAAAPLLAFFIGMNPWLGLDWLFRYLRRLIWRNNGMFGGRPLSTLDGLSALHEARIYQMGIDNVHNLAYADIRKLLLTTQFDAGQIVNWIDQAMLCAVVGEHFDALQKKGIGVFTRFADAVRGVTAATITTNPAAAATGIHDAATLTLLADPTTLPNSAHLNQYYARKSQVIGNYARDGASFILGARFAVVDADLQGIDEEVVDIEDAESDLATANRLAADNPYDEQALEAQGWLRRKLARTPAYQARKEALLDEARAAYDAAIALDPKRARYYVGRAAVHFAAQRANPTIADCTKALELQPGNATAFHFRGLAYADAASFESAIADFSRALAIDDRRAGSTMNRGFAYLNTGKMADAVRDFELTYHLGRRDARLLANWGKALLGAGKLDAAIEKLDAAINHNPDDPNPYSDRAFARYQQRDYARALQDYARAIALADAQGTPLFAPWLNKGHALAALGRPADAVAAYTVALAIARDGSEKIPARRGRALAYAQLGLFAQGQADLAEALTLAGSDPCEQARVHLDQAEIAVAQGDIAAARTLLQAIPPGCKGEAARAQARLLQPDLAPPEPPAPAPVNGQVDPVAAPEPVAPPNQ